MPKSVTMRSTTPREMTEGSMTEEIGSTRRTTKSSDVKKPRPNRLETTTIWNDKTTDDTGIYKTFWGSSLTTLELSWQRNNDTYHQSCDNKYIIGIVIVSVLNACLIIALIVICSLKQKLKKDIARRTTNLDTFSSEICLNSEKKIFQQHHLQTLI